MRLFLVRHAKPLIEPGVCYGATDVPCSDEAIEVAAKALLKTLLKTLPKNLAMISSPLSRCERLAQVLCWLEPTFSYKTDQRVAEMDFGAWELQPWANIAADELAAWTDAFAAYRCGGSGESTALFVQRVAQRLYESAQGGEDQIWITHAGVIRAVLWLAMQPYELFTALVSQRDPERTLSQLRAADWPAGEVAFGQLHLAHSGQEWAWPAAWPPSP